MLFHHFDDDVDGGHMSFLHAIGKGKARDEPLQIAKTFHLAARFTEEGDRLQSARFGHFGRLDEIGRIAAGRESDKNIARLSESLYSAGKDRFEAHVVGDATQVARIGERDGGKGGPQFSELPGEFFGEVHRVAETPPVAGDEDFIPPLETRCDEICRPLDKEKPFWGFESVRRTNRVVH